MSKTKKILQWKNKHKFQWQQNTKSFQFISLSVILIGSVFRTGKNCYPQVFLEECKYVIKELIIVLLMM